jgi:hypothetical protein
MSSSGNYERLADSEAPPVSADSEATRLLQPLFDKLRERLIATASTRPSGAGLVAALSVGSGDEQECWLIDTRDGVPPDAAVTRRNGATDAAPTVSYRAREAERAKPRGDGLLQ